jgi:hypothetical protein
MVKKGGFGENKGHSGNATCKKKVSKKNLYEVKLNTQGKRLFTFWGWNRWWDLGD